MSLAYATQNLVHYFQIDHTSRCNLLCQQCSRVHNGKLNPSMPLGELELADYENIFASNNWPQLREIFFCGNYGDASVSETFLPALKFLRNRNIQVLKLSTNGSARSPEWWRELASLLNRKHDLVAFSIDGLEDTNSIYRVNSNWKNIMSNAQAFIKAGGRARWDFIVFSHNEHQVETARQLAKTMGFHSFTVKKSNRFLKFEESSVQAPKIAEHQGQALSSVPKAIEEFGEWNSYLQKTKIQCRFRQAEVGLFLDFQARLWPCTWLAAPLHQYDETEQSPYIRSLLANYGEKFNCARSNTIESILSHPWFAQELVTSWSSETERSPTCARYCGSDVHFSSEHPENRKIEKL